MAPPPAAGSALLQQPFERPAVIDGDMAASGEDDACVAPLRELPIDDLARDPEDPRELSLRELQPDPGVGSPIGASVHADQRQQSLGEPRRYPQEHRILESLGADSEAFA